MASIQETREGCAICPTRHICTASDVSADNLASLTKCLTTTAPMNKGEFLYRANDSTQQWFVVRSGTYKSITVTAAGEEYITGFYYPGEILGLSGMAKGTFNESAVALTSATACGIDFQNLPVLWDLGAGQALMRLIGERDLAEQMMRINLSQSRAEARIAGYLKLLMDRTARLGFDPTCLPTPMSRTDLANHLGLTLECLSRVLSKWRKAGVIETGRDTMIIQQPEALTTAAFHLVA
ncbi:MAG: helix-turn-helix domain-containing protein [Pseudomonadales bacterium]